MEERDRSIHKIIGENVKRFREEQGYSQSYLGSCFGANCNRIRMIEDGQCDIKLSTVSKLALHLDVKVIDLVEDWEELDE